MKRRNFLQSAALASSATLLAPGALAESLRRERIKEFGFQSYTVRDFIYKDMAGTLKRLKKAGYDHMEGFDFNNGKFLGKPLAETMKIVNDSKINLKSIHIMTPNMGDKMQMTVDQAAETGTEYLVCAFLMPNERQSIDQYKALCEQFNKMGEASKKAGIQFAYHNHDFEFQEVDGQIPMDVILKETDSNLVKIELDIYWARKAEVNPLNFFRDNLRRVPLWHVKDLSLDEGQPMTEIGNGIIDWRQMFSHKNDAGLQYFFIEQDANFAEDSISSLETSIKYLKKLSY
ncbi:TIM barrel protein [Roseivirga sp.]|uniref:sugar phosphate isomerase/epimerase family protein n=1 Tax=Roseivirga sp. TaxID=1964215 RepID=UPI003B51DD92